MTAHHSDALAGSVHGKANQWSPLLIPMLWLVASMGMRSNDDQRCFHSLESISKQMLMARVSMAAHHSDDLTWLVDSSEGEPKITAPHSDALAGSVHGNVKQ